MRLDHATGIVVLAAGEAVRYGSPKQLVAMDGLPMVRRMALAALAVSSRVTVVVGAHGEQVSPVLADLPLHLAFHADWSLGQGGSVACGVTHIQRHHPQLSAVIVCPCDQVDVGSQSFEALLSASRKAPARIIAAKYFDGTLGAPSLFPARFFEGLMALRGVQGAKSLLRQHAGDVEALPMPEAEMDIDTPHDYRVWLARHANRTNCLIET